ncbi:MAG: hypothetical protein HYW47_00805 [Deltaproteobacteria bacterium]|nr:hypothetical protein [Deltaproteobacteria bacterium]
MTREKQLEKTLRVVYNHLILMKNITFSFLILFFISFLKAQEISHTSELVFLGEKQLLFLHDVTGYYLNSTEKIAYTTFKDSEDPQSEKAATHLIKRKLLEVFEEELFLFEGERLFVFTKKKVPDSKIFLFNKGKKSVLFGEDAVQERKRVKKEVEKYLFTQFASQIYITPGEVRDFYHAHQEEFIKTRSVTLYEIKILNDSILNISFERNKIEDTLKAQLQKTFFRVLDQQVKLNAEVKLDLWHKVYDREDGLSIRESVLLYREDLEAQGIDVDSLLGSQNNGLAYELHNRIFVLAFYKALKDITDNALYQEKALELQNFYNALFPGLVSVRVIEGLTPLTVTSDIHPDIHGSFAFPKTKEDQERWLLWIPNIPNPSFFLLRTLEKHQELFSWADTVDVDRDEKGNIVKEVSLNEFIKRNLIQIQLNHKIARHREELFERYLSGSLTKDEKVQKLFPHKEYFITYSEIESTFLK